MDLTLNNQQSLICHESQTNKQTNKEKMVVIRNNGQAITESLSLTEIRLADYRQTICFFD